MSYRCEKCNTVVGRNIPQKRVVTKTKKVTHMDSYKDEDGRSFTVETQGLQIVKEIAVCEKCALILKQGGAEY